MWAPGSILGWVPGHGGSYSGPQPPESALTPSPLTHPWGVGTGGVQCLAHRLTLIRHVLSSDLTLQHCESQEGRRLIVAQGWGGEAAARGSGTQETPSHPSVPLQAGLALPTPRLFGDSDCSLLSGMAPPEATLSGAGL